MGSAFSGPWAIIERGCLETKELPSLRKARSKNSLIPLFKHQGIVNYPPFSQKTEAKAMELSLRRASRFQTILCKER